MKKILFILFILTISFFSIKYLQFEKSEELIQSFRSNNLQNSPITQSQEFAVPKLISIPKINVKADIESVGKDSKGNMDVPKITQNVAWYNLGYKPGEKGNAVVAGHYDNQTGQPAVFWELNKLNKGDEIVVEYDSGKILHFEVTHKNTYPNNNFPIKEVFGETDIARLNLITCSGKWDTSSQLYSDRIVVYSRLIES